MNRYVEKGFWRIPLHASFFAAATELPCYLWWRHWLLFGALGVAAAIGKELFEECPFLQRPLVKIGWLKATFVQDWGEFAVDASSQAAGALAGVLFAWIAIHKP